MYIYIYPYIKLVLEPGAFVTFSSPTAVPLARCTLPFKSKVIRVTPDTHNNTKTKDKSPPEVSQCTLGAVCC